MKRLLNNILNTLVVLATTLIFINIFADAIPAIKIRVEANKDRFGRSEKFPVFLENSQIPVHLDNSELKVKAEVETGYSKPLKVEASTGYYSNFKIQVQQQE